MVSLSWLVFKYILKVIELPLFKSKYLPEKNLQHISSSRIIDSITLWVKILNVTDKITSFSFKRNAFTSNMWYTLLKKSGQSFLIWPYGSWKQHSQFKTIFKTTKI